MLLPILIIIMSLLVSFFMSGMETGVFSLSRLRLRRLVRAGNPQARLLLGYLEEPEDFLWTILVGNTLANLVAVGLTVGLLRPGLNAKSLWVWSAFLVFVLFFYFWCELLPKMVFRPKKLNPTKLNKLETF